MRNRIAVVLCALVLVAGVPLALSAQITSPTANISTGMFLTDADNAFGSLNVVNFSALDGKSIFVGDFSSATDLSIGYATKLGGIYMGAAYSGNIYKDTTYANNSYDTTELLGGDGTVIGTRQTSSSGPYTTASNDNNLSILIGFGKIGIDASVGESSTITKKNYFYNPASVLGLGSQNWGSWSNTYGGTDSTSTTSYTSNNVKTTTTITPYSAGSTDLTPTLTAGMVIDLGGLVIKPKLSINADFNSQNYGSQWVKYDTTDGSGLPTYQSIADVTNYTSSNYAYKLGYTGLDGTIGSRFEKGVWIFDLYYTFNTDLYSNSYLDSDGKTTKTANGTVSSLAYTAYTTPTMSTTQTATTYGYEVDPKTYYEHDIAGNVQCTLPIADKLKVAMSFQPLFKIKNSSSSANGSQVTTTVNTDSVTPTNGTTTVETKSYTGTSTTTSEMDFSPIIAGALKYSIIDNVLDFNLGTKINLADLTTVTNTSSEPGYSSDKTVTTNNNGTVALNSYTSTIGTARTESSDTTFTLSNVSASMTWGLTWKLLDNVTLDTYFYSLYGSVSGNSAILGTDAFTVMLSIKK